MDKMKLRGEITEILKEYRERTRIEPEDTAIEELVALLPKPQGLEEIEIDENRLKIKLDLPAETINFIECVKYLCKKCELSLKDAKFAMDYIKAKLLEPKMSECPDCNDHYTCGKHTNNKFPELKNKPLPNIGLRIPDGAPEEKKECELFGIKIMVDKDLKKGEWYLIKDKDLFELKPLPTQKKECEHKFVYSNNLDKNYCIKCGEDKPNPTQKPIEELIYQSDKDVIEEEHTFIVDKINELVRAINAFRAERKL